MKTNNRIYIILSCVLALLSIPLIAMQFTDQVDWKAGDFVVMGGLLLGVGIIIELTLRYASHTKWKVILIAATLLAFILVWLELAVGIFDSPLAGS